MKVIPFTALCLIYVCAAAQNSSYKPCSTYQDVVDDFGPHKPNYHTYRYSTEICNLNEYPECTVDFVYSVMVLHNAHVAPTNNPLPVADCASVGLFVGFIITKLYPEQFKVVNYTQTVHVLHPGKVDRAIVQENNRIFIKTLGVGNHSWWLADDINKNQRIVNSVWSGPDQHLKKSVISQLNTLRYRGTKLLFGKVQDWDTKKRVADKISFAQKMHMYAQMGLRLSKDFKGFYSDDECGQQWKDEFTVSLYDMNADGEPEVIIEYYNYCEFGNTGSSVDIFKKVNGVYKNFFSDVGSYFPVNSSTGRHKDFILAGPGMTRPIVRWNGSRYRTAEWVDFSE